MICEKNKVLKTPRPTVVTKIGGSWTVFSTFFGICQIKKYIYQSESITLTHAVVNLTINSKVKMESRIVRLFIVGFNITNSLNHKL